MRDRIVTDFPGQFMVDADVHGKWKSSLIGASVVQIPQSIAFYE
jgi:hypothetical protein